MILVLFFVNNRKYLYECLSYSTKMCPYTTFLCTKFQSIRIYRFHFMLTLAPLRKEKNKQKSTKKLSKFLEVHMSEMPGAI